MTYFHAPISSIVSRVR